MDFPYRFRYGFSTAVSVLLPCGSRDAVNLVLRLDISPLVCGWALPAVARVGVGDAVEAGLAELGVAATTTPDSIQGRISENNCSADRAS